MAEITEDDNHTESVDQTCKDTNSDIPKPKTSTFVVQIAPECKSSDVLCNRKHRKRTQQGINLGSNVDVKGVDNLEESDSGDDPSWTPDVSEEHNVEYTADPHNTLRYIVFENSLMELLDVCPNIILGVFFFVKTYCLCVFYRRWTSQPLHYSIPLRNLLVVAAAFSVATVNKLFLMSMSSYNTIQSCYTVPATLTIWAYKQHLYLYHVRGKGQALKLGGDARCFSTGHTAKYGSYTLLDVQTSKVVDIQLVQVMQEEKVSSSDLVTDHHSQVNKYMRTQQERTNHWFDVWHMTKEEKSNIILQWSRTISNHMYWCAASSQGHGELVRHTWTSILNHIADVHEGSKAHVEVAQIVCGRLLLKNIQKLSPAEQTSSLESLHNTICFFCPKI
ncbi:hypothetical protein ACJMK2_001434 [Sinanodonta woodiana]|uniref:Uncharacterized protein n=1 Tax=Sinanodonta woodiana TaxID=1069815 RepID=A0ABD3XVK7_SINWO